MTQNLCLTIAGSDSGGEAGIQADLATFRDFSCHGLCAITALTAQNPASIIALHPTPATALEDQLRAIFDYFKVKYIKTGLLPTVETMRTIIKCLPAEVELISDPIIASSSAKTIMDEAAINFYKNEFTQKITYMTPNFPEALILTGKEFCPEQLSSLSQLSKGGFFLKGGHSDSCGTDYFADGNKLWKLTSPTLNIKSSHGTGCRLSSAFCAGLANGHSPLQAAILAKNYVYHALKSCPMTSQGQWLISSPGKIATLENEVSVSEVL